MAMRGCGLRDGLSRHVSASSEDARGLKHGEAVRDSVTVACGWVWACPCVCWRVCVDAASMQTRVGAHACKQEEARVLATGGEQAVGGQEQEECAHRS